MMRILAGFEQLGRTPPAPIRGKAPGGNRHLHPPLPIPGASLNWGFPTSAESTACRSVIPIQADRRFQRMPIVDSDMPITLERASGGAGEADVAMPASGGRTGRMSTGSLSATRA